MKIHDIPFGVTDWSTIPQTEHAGATGTAFGRACQFGPIRVRMVEYTANYLARLDLAVVHGFLSTSQAAAKTDDSDC